MDNFVTNSFKSITRKTLANAGPEDEPIANPPTCM